MPLSILTCLPHVPVWILSPRPLTPFARSLSLMLHSTLQNLTCTTLLFISRRTRTRATLWGVWAMIASGWKVGCNFRKVRTVPSSLWSLFPLLLQPNLFSPPWQCARAPAPGRGETGYSAFFFLFCVSFLLSPFLLPLFGFCYLCYLSLVLLFSSKVNAFFDPMWDNRQQKQKNFPSIFSFMCICNCTPSSPDVPSPFSSPPPQKWCTGLAKKTKANKRT